MLAEGFLRLLCYREERKFASKRSRRHTDPRAAEPSGGPLPDSAPANLQVQENETGQNQEGPDSSPDLRGAPLVPRGLSIPAAIAQLPVCIEDCSLLEQYPDLQVADSGRISNNLSRSAVNQHGPLLPDGPTCPPPERGAAPRGSPALSIPDQGYLAMGHSADISLDLPGSGLEPMSNSVLNGLLEKQLEEVYMQHLTDNLARCNSHLGNSLLHGLVPPPQPGSQPGGPDSLGPSMGGGDGSGDSGEKISYLNTHNLGACSSNFSSPVLRISESATLHPP